MDFIARQEAVSRKYHSEDLPPDPDDMNDERSCMAGQAVNAFEADSSDFGARAIEAFGEVSKTRSAGEDERTIAADLLCNLIHWADRAPICFDSALMDAQRTYAEGVENCPAVDTDGESNEQVLSKLLCNLMHWCDERAIDFNQMIFGAKINYQEETRDEEGDD